MLIGIEMLGTQHPRCRGRGIGRYTEQLIAALLAQDQGNQYILYVYEELAPSPLPPGKYTLRTLRFSQAPGQHSELEQLAQQNRDGLELLLLTCPLYPLPGFAIPSKPANGLKIAAIVYDLIPALFPREYLRGEFARWYYRDLQSLRNYDGLLAISAATKQDCESFLGMSAHRVTNIRSASDGKFFPLSDKQSLTATERASLQALGVTQPFVFNVGAGMEWRKNFHGLLQGFARLPASLRQSHQLILTCGLHPGEAQRMRQLAEEEGVGRQLILTGEVPDETLRLLYQTCAAFLFPSHYEGFGLPVLEALLCGAPVVAGHNSAQPEVVGDAGLLADVANPQHLANQLGQVLENKELAKTLKSRGPQQGRRFCWQDTADATLAAFRTMTSRPSPALRRFGRKPRLAFFAALAPQKGQVAEDTLSWLALFKQHYTIDLYHEEDFLPRSAFQVTDFACYDHRLFRRHQHLLNYQNVVYLLGESLQPQFVYEGLLRQAGVVIFNSSTIALDSRARQQANALMVVHESENSEWLQKQYAEDGERAFFIARRQLREPECWPRLTALVRDLGERTALPRQKVTA